MIKEIKIPTTCPSCNSTLEKVNSQLFCRNSDCPAQSTKKIEAFAKKMRIKGLGPSSISKLELVSLLDIYDLTIDLLEVVLGGKIGNKIYEEIQNSKHTSFSTFLGALSIPLIGDTASKKINTVVNNLSDIIDRLDELPIGDKARENLINHLEENDDVFILEEHFTFTEPKTESKNRGNVCITGKLNDFSNRAKAKEFLEDHGYTVTSTLSSKTNFLVDEENKISSKRKKAESLGIPVVTIETLINRGN